MGTSCSVSKSSAMTEGVPTTGSEPLAGSVRADSLLCVLLRLVGVACASPFPFLSLCWPVHHCCCGDMSDTHSFCVQSCKDFHPAGRWVRWKRIARYVSVCSYPCFLFRDVCSQFCTLSRVLFLLIALRVWFFLSFCFILFRTLSFVDSILFVIVRWRTIGFWAVVCERLVAFLGAVVFPFR